MGRKVYISSDMSTDDRLMEAADHSPMAPILWPWLLTAFDDWGRAEAVPRTIKAKVFPSFDAVTTEHVAGALNALASAGLIMLYEIGHKQYMAIPPEKWFRYQTQIPRDKRKRDSSRIPAPDHSAVARDLAESSAVARDLVPSPSPSPSPSPLSPFASLRDAPPSGDASLPAEHHAPVAWSEPAEAGLRFEQDETAHVDLAAAAKDQDSVSEGQSAPLSPQPLLPLQPRLSVVSAGSDQVAVTSDLGAEAQALATAAYDVLKDFGRIPADQRWVGRAIGRIKQLRPEARARVSDAVRWAVQPGAPSYVGTWLSKCDFSQILDAYGTAASHPPARAAPEPAGFAAIRAFVEKSKQQEAMDGDR